MLLDLFSPSSSNEETMYPVAHDWLHVDGSRVEPEDEGKDCQEEADNGCEQGVVFLLPTLGEPYNSQNQKTFFFLHIGEAAVENVRKADDWAPGKNASGNGQSLGRAIFGIFFCRQDTESESQGESKEGVELEGKSPVVSKEHDDEGPDGKTEEN